MTRKSTAFTDIDFDRNGRQVGFVAIPHSPHSDAWGQVRIPMAVIKNGVGPTVVLQGGNHGDEYEGPITLGEIIRDLGPATVSGRLIILPAVNAPAVAQGHRTSPVDGLNFNRSFPGDPLGAVVRAGELAGRVHNLPEPGEPPHALHFAVDGVVFGRRHPGRVVSGNCCAVVAAPYEGSLG